MQLEVTRVCDVGSAPHVVWAFIRDVARLSGCIPNVSDLQVEEPESRYTAVVSDKLGPFTLSVPVEIDVSSVDDQHRITAAVMGNDRRGQARIKGTLGASVEPLQAGSRLALSMQLEILGRLVSIGAAPMRRRADEIFSRFAECVESELSA